MPKGYSTREYRRGPAPGWVYSGRKPGRKPKGDHLPLVRQYVEQEGLTHQQAADLIGVHRSRVTQICLAHDIQRPQ